MWYRPSEIIMVRHPQSLRNAIIGPRNLHNEAANQRFFETMPDARVPLTDAGRLHAHNVWPIIVKTFGPPDQIYHSGYQRLEEMTAELFGCLTFGEVARTSIHRLRGLREKSLGRFWASTRDEIQSRYPEQLWDFDQGVRMDFRPPGGESVTDLIRGRVRRALATILGRHPGERIYLPLHGFVISAITMLLTHSDPLHSELLLREAVPWMSVTRFVFTDGSKDPMQTHHRLVLDPVLQGA